MAKDAHCQFLKQVAKETDSIFFGPEWSFFGLWPLLKDARFLISGHYHYVMIGSMVGCPFIPLSTNSHKMQGVCEHLCWHLTNPSMLPLKTEADTIVLEAKRLVDNYEQFSAHLIAPAEFGAEAAENAVLVRDAIEASKRGSIVETKRRQDHYADRGNLLSIKGVRIASK